MAVISDAKWRGLTRVDSSTGSDAERCLGRGAATHPGGASHGSPLSAFVDTNILIRHLTGDPPDMAGHATRFLATERDLLVTDLIVAETVYVLESFYKAPRPQVAEAMRSLIAFDAIIVVDPALLLRAVEVYEVDRVDFAEAYLVASAESTGVGRVASFDQAIDRIDTVERVEPPPA